MGLARCLAVYLAAPVALGNVWQIDSITADLGCAGTCANTPAEVIASSSQTGCADDQISTGTVTVGTCMNCTDEPYGPGYYCDSGAVVLCPNGHYCPDYLQKIECPEDKWCREGFISPEECRVPMVTCPAGSEQQFAGLGFIIGFTWMILIGCCCSCCIGIRKAKAEAAMKQAAAEIDDDDVVLGADFTSDLPSLTIEFQNLSMHLKSNGKCVLDNVTGKFPGSSLVALMGPSGGGKTTFMNALCGRASYGNVSGKIFINSKEGGVTDFPNLVGFVPQDDIMHCDLTVHQNLYYNARLRLPRSVPYDAMLAHVNQVVKTLGLEKIAHSIVGSPEKRGISGGQKKRVNIGMELAAMPAVIFMDEPTSGLDGAATIQLAKCLSKLRASGLTIVCVIHQPRYAVFAEFSHLLLLGAGGGQIYCGEALKIEDYLLSLGFRCPPKENPADWMIDVACGLSPRYVDDAIDETFTAPVDLFGMWADKYKGQETPYDGPGYPVGEPLTHDRYTPNFLWQTFIFLIREARKWNKSSFTSTCIMLFVCGTIFGLMTSSVAEFSYAGMMQLLSGNGFLFFMICTINARGVFGFERLEFMREFSSGTSCVAYWLAKTLWNVINLYMYTLCYSLPLYWLMPVPAQRYNQFFDAFLMAAWYHLGLGMVLTVVFPNATTSLLMCVFVPMILELAFSGGLIKIREMSGLTLWCSACSCGRWFKQTLFIQEMKNFPSHTHDFTAVQGILTDYDTKMSDGGSGLLWLFIVGLVLRLWTLCVLLLLKYSEGNSCIGRIVHLISKGLHKIGVSALIAPKAGDTVDSKNVIQRKPSQLIGI